MVAKTLFILFLLHMCGLLNGKICGLGLEG